MSIALAAALFIGFILVHAIKLMRLYLILVEEDIPFGRFVPAYFRTTLLNLIIPYKLGEIYRIGVFARITGGFRIGFLSVLVDRFFDTLALVLILLPYQLVISGRITLPVLLLFVFVVCVVFFYLVFPSTYTFLNRYIIVKRTSSRSLAVLGGLEAVHEWYEYVKKLVTGRYGMLTLFSFGAWIGEIMVLAGFYKLWGNDFALNDFGGYIESIVSGGTYSLKERYSLISIIIILAITVITLAMYLIKKTVKSRMEE